MALKTIFFGLFLIFFSSAILVDCVHKNSSYAGNSDPADPVEITEEINTLTQAEIEDGWILLFDGKTLDGWRGFKEDHVPEWWVVEEGYLMTPGEGDDLGGDIMTENMFENFEIYLEWKISKGGNSGVFFRVLEDDYTTVYATGPEYQLIDDLGYPENLEDWQTCGANYGMHPPVQPRIKPAGEWNSLRLIVDSTHVTHYLNDIKVVEYDLWSDEWNRKVQAGKWAEYPGYGQSKTGHIALQDHGDSVWFRNIKIRNL